MVLIQTELFEDLNDSAGGHLRVSFPEGSDCAPFLLPLQPIEDTLSGWAR